MVGEYFRNVSRSRERSPGNVPRDTWPGSTRTRRSTSVSRKRPSNLRRPKIPRRRRWAPVCKYTYRLFFRKFFRTSVLFRAYAGFACNYDSERIAVATWGRRSFERVAARKWNIIEVTARKNKTLRPRRNDVQFESLRHSIQPRFADVIVVISIFFFPCPLA